MKSKLVKITFLIITCLMIPLSFSRCSSPEDGVDGEDGINGADGQGTGKTHIVLSGNITDEEARQTLLDDLGKNTQTITIKNTTQLTTIDFSEFTLTLKLVGLTVDSNSALTTLQIPTLTDIGLDLQIINNDLSEVSLPNLTRVGDIISVKKNKNLTNLDLPLLEKVGHHLIIKENSALTSIDFQLLVAVGNVFDVAVNPALTSINLPLLADVGNELIISSNKQLTTLLFPELTTIKNDIEINYNPLLIDLTFTKLATVGDDISLIENSSLRTFALPALSTMGDDFRVRHNMLDVASVNGLLAQLVSITPALTDQRIELQQLPATAPTGQGAIDKATLETSNRVITD